MNPYLILGVPRTADDSRIRQAYLAAIKESPPDTHPDRFQAVSAAYDLIKDESSRIRYYLFHRDCPGATPVDAVLRFLQTQPPPQPLPFDSLKEWLRTCAKI